MTEPKICEWWMATSPNLKLDTSFKMFFVTTVLIFWKNSSHASKQMLWVYKLLCFVCSPADYFLFQYLLFQDKDLRNYWNHFLKQIDWYNHCKYLQYRCLLNILYLTREQFEEITKTFVVILNRSDLFTIFKIFAIENNSYEDVFFGNNKVKISDNFFLSSTIQRA